MDPETNTQVASTKKLLRQEKKKKKMLAYLEVAKLNDLDRVKTAVITQNDLSDFTASEDEPSFKKAKIENLDFIENNNITNDVTTVIVKHERTEVTGSGKPRLTGEEFVKLKETLRKRTESLRKMPRLTMKDAGNAANISLPPEDRTPLFLSDVQHLLMYSLLGNNSPYKPHRWCHLEKMTKLTQTVAIVIENMSLCHYTAGEPHFQNLAKSFSNKVEIVTPSVYRGDLIEEVAAVPLTSTQKDKLVMEFGSLEEALESSKVFSMIKAVFPVNDRLVHEKEKRMNLPRGDKFPRTHLLLSAWQLVEESYPLPLKGTLRDKYITYVLTKDSYDEVTPHSPMYGIDCEMCMTTSGENELTRVSVVNEQHEGIYDQLVKPWNPITNYLTRFSGITRQMLQNVTYRLEDVQRDLRELLPADAILVGQSLNSDMHALKMMHPYCIDTSVIFNVTGVRSRKTKLQTLAREFLDEKIQQGNDGHSPIEDSLSSLKLVQLKLARSIEFGDAILSGQKGCLQSIRNMGDNYYGSSLLHHITKIDKTAAVIGQGNSIERYEKYMHRSEMKNKISCIVKDTNKSIVKFLCQRSGDYNLSLAHLQIHESDLVEDKLEQTCQFIDKSVRRVCASLPNHCLCVVLFGGEVGGNGVCFVQLKKKKLRWRIRISNIYCYQY